MVTPLRAPFTPFSLGLFSQDNQPIDSTGTWTQKLLENNQRQISSKLLNICSDFKSISHNQMIRREKKSWNVIIFSHYDIFVVVYRKKILYILYPIYDKIHSTWKQFLIWSLRTVQRIFKRHLFKHNVMLNLYTRVQVSSTVTFTA